VPLGFGRSKSDDVVSLIAARDYGRAIEVLRAQLKKRGASTTLRKQLADVLELSGKTNEAVALLLPLADQFAREGFAAKAVAILKKIQKIDPGRRDVEERLAQLIEEKQREAVVLPDARSPEIGIEEIGIDPPAPAGAEGGPAPAPPGAATPAAGELEIGVGSGVAAPAPAPPAPAPPAAPVPPAPAPAARPTPPTPAEPEPAPILSVPVEPLPALDTPEIAATAPPSTPAPAPPPPDSRPAAAAPAAASDDIEDYDLLYQAEEGEEDEDEEVTIEVEAMGEVAPMSDGAFADELMSLVDTVFQESPATAPAPASGAVSSSGAQIVVSPLFRDFAVDEMVAVIHGLKLLSFERGEVILREGAPGGSLYTLTSGRERAFRKDQASGKQVPLGDLKEGAFFGEMSILTGQPRMASVVALTRCELLELDRATLDDITSRHPHVWDVLREFAGKRSPARG
jgi:hypothetical protein